ncbi:DUF1887 family protein [Sphaerospermopsis sp. LEGE 00249]|uniref:Card1-like endonuclease domain-containing protein n=1 Tax=Sphaerospermopsis sp. LEGE 00249 TaxID=1380707 RepID=UPI00164CE8C3|nr:DUF1887 family CARF protein [Sphaerospermopsis sp. LEGE 00249]MBC5796849.1 DUF1887 family protein [Sphaerospermopsis sp. LEGE 00249]
MSEKVMLVLIGGRSAVPPVAGVLQFLDDIDKIKFLICQGEQFLQYQKNVENLIKQKRPNLLFNKETDLISVDPSKFDDVYIAVEKLCQDVDTLKYVNLTSAPQTMAISVYSYVQEKYKDVLIFSINTNQSQIIPLVFGKQPVAFNQRLTVKDYVTMYGFNIFQKNDQYESSSYLEELVKYIVDNIESSIAILSLIRSIAGEDIKPPKGLKISEKELSKLDISSEILESFLRKLEKFSIIKNLEISITGIKFKLETKEEYAFLKGDWLEIFTYYSAKKCNFDSVEMGVHINNYRGEIDVFCLNNTNALICECKTGKKLDSDDLSILNSKAEKLGGNYCVKLFITSECEVDEKFINQAKNNKVVVISGKELKNLTDILIQQMQNPTYKRL